MSYLFFEEESRRLEKARSLDGWTTFGQAAIALTYQQPLSDALLVQMKVTVSAGSATPVGVNNGGFFGYKSSTPKLHR